MSTGFSLARWFQEGGAGMFALLLLTLPCLSLAILHAVFARRWSAIAGWAGLAVVAAAGVGFMMHARGMVEQAIAFVDPSMRARIAEQGMSEARRPLELATVICALAFVPLLVGGVRRFLAALADRPKENP